MAKKTEAGERAPRVKKTLDEKVARERESIAFHQRGIDRSRARLAALVDEKRKRAAMLMDEAASVERMTALPQSVIPGVVEPLPAANEF